MASIDQYEKLRLIGNGSFASIWKVRHKELGYIRAIKESKELVTDEHDKAYQTFLKECKVLLRLGNGGHPNIVRIYEPRLIDNRATVEMDFIQGETLNDYLARVRFMPMDEVLRFVREIVGALAYCHFDIYKYLLNPETDELEPDPADATRYLIPPEKERQLVAKYGVVHNDLHSNNIMRRDVDGGFVLLDFGLSVQDGQAVKSSARNDGALEYLAPEKWEPTMFPQGIGTWTDVYSLGILLYEVLAGRVPFALDPMAMASEQARHELYTHHMQDTPPPIEPLRKAAFEATHPGKIWSKDYPQWLEDIIMKCLAKKPEDRYANAREVLNIIKKHKQGQNLSVTNSSNINTYCNTTEQNHAEEQHKSEQQHDKKNASELQIHELQARLAKLEKKLSEKEAAKPLTAPPSQPADSNEAVQHDAEAQYELGNDYALGRGVEKDFKQAVYWFRKAAEQGSAAAQYQLGDCYYKGYGVAQDYKQAVYWFRKAAEQGYAEAQYKLGDCYYYGNGVAQDYRQAMQWYRKAAEQGYAEAQGELGKCYYFGNGVAQDRKQAVRWYRKAAEKGYAKAQYKLGNCYYFGVGVAQDRKQAVQWYRKAAEQGYAEAQCELGDCYFYSHGVTKDRKQAMQWFRKAAVQGHAKAQYKLGYCYFLDDDFKQAMQWYRKAADNGYEYAQYELGNCYYYGHGITKARKQAMQWYHKAADNGSFYAQDKLKKLRLKKILYWLIVFLISIITFLISYYIWGTNHNSETEENVVPEKVKTESAFVEDATPKDAEVDIDDDLKYLKQNNRWNYNQLKSYKYKKLFNCFVVGDIEGIINSDYPQQNPHNGWFDRIVEQLKELTTEEEKTRARIIMKDEASYYSFNLQQLYERLAFRKTDER